MIKLLIGGSPCTHWSISQTKNREVAAEGEGWELFKNYLIAKEKFKPDFFLYENNKSAAKPIKEQISRELGVELMHINSALVSAQSRERFYAFNWEVEQPEDRKIYMCDLLSDEDYAVYNGSEMKRIKEDLTDVSDKLWQLGHTDKKNGQACRVYDIHGKSVTLRGQAGGGGAKTGLYLVNGEVKKLSLSGAKKVQTLPEWYKFPCKTDKAIDGIGNGWTAEVIIHILNGALKDVPKDEEIVVLSMYDGIATGRYCLDKMGFTNVKYYAYEIDECAKQIANANYPDIIQMGDAFDVRKEDWKCN